MGVIYQEYILCQAYSQCTIFGCLGVLPEVLYHFCGSAPTRVVRETFNTGVLPMPSWTIFVGALPQTWYSSSGSTPKDPK